MTLRPGLGFGPTQWPGGARYWAGVGLLAAGWRCWASALCWARPSGQGAGARVHGCTAGSVVRWLGLRGPSPPALFSSSVHGAPGAARRLSPPPFPCSLLPRRRWAVPRSGSAPVYSPLCSSTLSGASTSVPSARLGWRHSFPLLPTTASWGAPCRGGGRPWRSHDRASSPAFPRPFLGKDARTVRSRAWRRC